ncbi:Hydrogen cyanide synthase subunit HcnC [Paraburkholderia aspalathi]|uniref:NAD(P)/FAD-dependent oxidoreductase n=1 Tax=Paraburkholderia aspalathi TaxID=1324617 RepID=UPI00190BE073|nr:FAD-dependent oxidoreductase [Paraburkholderia aspalathi]MBK3843202.1 FAD-binding oxidoreductase [Paraburkholderia aspalathi]CAE6847919.1 Hydrogen cyanide synthase subunit HcnC [Paraburkholderia aspalathi]CAE6858080.1 Hydrogen cyanide synthase subunit HcnC [Paraburkholderia aspalathi]
MTLAANSADVVIVGGGLVGASLAYGLAKQNQRVVILDADDTSMRAAHGNFGLVWVQNKGYGLGSYARWSRRAAGAWQAFAQSLIEETGVDPKLEQRGGFHLCFDDVELSKRQVRLESIRASLDGDYPFRMIERPALEALLPGIGPKVAGASFTGMDGQVNPLMLLRALYTACRQRGVKVRGGQRVETIRHLPAGGFEIDAGDAQFDAARVVLSAGLGNARLATQVSLSAPVRPNRGQILITERVERFLDYPTPYVRQTDNGSLQLGDSMEDVGLDDGVTTDMVMSIAARAIRCFPALEHIKLVRSWGALRVMSPDGFPIYEASKACPGAFVATCHSGVTLAPLHAGPIANWIADGTLPDGIADFGSERFNTENVPYEH